MGNDIPRLKWWAYGSPLSRHKQSEFVALAGRSSRLKVFTPVDTLNLIVSLFLAARPPTVLLVAGGKGSMKRALVYS
ncbi:hypothetical protein C7999DRAFT_31875 [Corynascus novoguineensis]|uniref:Uncharacterized protein n=1 Tax=Corynascus novoguineensis TaxID=1126955 RepID=A0AAN7HQK3_9PEZI|nr:hypothetical protein C7999DRAFT_31875 [Corynascus novoguineensis]